MSSIACQRPIWVRFAAAALVASTLSSACDSRSRHRDLSALRAARPAKLAHTEFVLFPGDSLIATTSVGTIAIRADDWLKRSYSWDGGVRSVVMIPRDGRWHGSMGVYFPGDGFHWKPHAGIGRAVLEEGELHFESMQKAKNWMRAYIPHPRVATRDGLVVKWRKELPPPGSRYKLGVLAVEVWQFVINGRKPVDFPDSNDSQIRVVRYETSPGS